MTTRHVLQYRCKRQFSCCCKEKNTVAPFCLVLPPISMIPKNQSLLLQYTYFVEVWLIL